MYCQESITPAAKPAIFRPPKSIGAAAPRMEWVALQVKAIAMSVLETALQKVYVEALQRKAAAMGQGESVHEGRGADGELELTIRVRVP